VRILLVTFTLVWSGVFLPGTALGQAATKVHPPKVGYIYVVGNDVTLQDVILRQLPDGLSPGQTLQYPDLRVVERNLANLDFFENNPKTGVRPTVEVLDREGDAEYKDLLVKVQEMKTSRLMRMVGVNSRGELVASLVWEERNFDPTRFPTGRDDLVSGRAFRGAGITFRLELIQVPLAPLGSLRFLQTGSLLVPIGR
jgi:outer membrane protein assembly factor BamA